MVQRRRSPMPPTIVVAPADAEPPFVLDARVTEEDTYQLLSPGVVIEEPRQSAAAIIHEALDSGPLQPGTVFTRGSWPLELIAVTHDFDREPSCRPTWVEEALEGILREVGARQVHAIGMPLMGTRFGFIPLEASAALLFRVLRQQSHTPLEGLWLFAPKDTAEAILSVLQPLRLAF